MSDSAHGRLALKYRPRRFGDVVSQRPVLALLYRMCQRGAVPGVMLFYGERGCGKTTMARIVAKALNCEAGPGKASAWPCGRCPSCLAVDDGTHPNVEELDAASNGGVEEVRALRVRASYGPSAGGHLVYIIDEAHGLSGPAFEASLTILEDPPPGVLFILCTTQPGSVPEPVRSRCSPFQFHPLTEDAIAGRLAHICEQEQFQVEPALLTAIAKAARGGMRDAIVRLDQVTTAGIGSLALWRQLTGETDFAPVLLAAAADGDYDVMYATMSRALSSYGDPAQVVRELVRCLADLLVVSCGGSPDATGEALEARRELAARLGAPRVSKAMAVLWDLHARVRMEDRESALTLALSVVSDKLRPREEVVPIASRRDEPASLGTIKSIMETT
jgi:DNA polymerase-3 subunit gamma/tau